MSAIEFTGLTKRYKHLTALDNITFEVAERKVTGLFGPNGAGKSTALKCLLGLAAPTSGSATFSGRPYSEIENPLTYVGALLDTRSFIPGITGRNNLKIEAAVAGVGDARIEEVLELVDLTEHADRKFKEYSLGMKQRLGLATALIGSPKVLILDEPGNGLDPIGIVWLRNFLRKYADAGNSVFISSHQLAEMQHTVDDVVILHKGKLLASGTKDDVCQGQGLEDAFLRIVGVTL